MTTRRHVRTAAVLLPLALAAAFPADAQTPVLRHKLGGAWDLITDGESPGWGPNPNNDIFTVGTRVPELGDEARVNWGGAEVTVDYDAPEFLRLLIGVDEDGTVSVNQDGVLTTTEDIVAGNNGFVDGTLNVNDGGEINVGRILWVGRGPADIFDPPNDVRGFLNINAGGVANVASHLWWGTTGEAFVEIDGTLNQTGGILGLGTVDAINPGGGVATVNVNSGGEFNLNNIDSTDGLLGSIQPGSLLNINGAGRVTIPGDFTSTIEAYRVAGRLAGDGNVGNVVTTLETGPAPGDFNEDGVVDAADYTVYRDNIGAASLPNDDGLGVVGQQHYNLWAQEFGESGAVLTVVTAGIPSAAAVPEPAAAGVVFSALASTVCLRRRR